MRYLVLSPNYSRRWNSVHEVFKQDLFDGKDVVFFGPGYPLWEDRTYSAVDLMHKFEADVLFIFHSKWTRTWLTDIHLVKNSINYQVDYYPTRDNEAWRNDYLIFNDFNIVIFPNRFMIDQFLAMNKGRKLPMTLYLPFGVNTDLFKPDSSVEKSIDISGIMSCNAKEYLHRENLYEIFRKAQTPNAFFHRINGTKDAFPLEMYISSLQKSKISLHSCDKYRSTAMRCFEILACGAVLLTDIPSDFNFLGFEDRNHYISYDVDRIKKLPNKIDRLLKDYGELSRISKSGTDFINKYHTNKHRADKLWSFVKGAL
jgi:hypothetical protein